MVKSHTARNLCARVAISVVFLTGVSAPALAQSAADKAQAEYSSLLEQIANTKLILAQKDAYIATQEAEIASLQEQLKRAEGLKASVGPMLSKMAAAIEGEMNADLPFKPGERFARLDKLREIIGDAEAAPAEKMRLALNIYDVEVGYGQTLEAYPGDHPMAEKAGARLTACRADVESSLCALDKKQKEKIDKGATIEDLKEELKDGNYLRYGRMALAYMVNDASEAYRYDPAAKAWEELPAPKVLEVRRGIRIAKGEAAPGVVSAPIYLTE